ncbi:MAG: hypothetical protein AAF674_21440 [Pseudomonadota bacterium]
MTDQTKKDAQTLSDTDVADVQGGFFNPRNELMKRGFNPQPEPPAKPLQTKGMPADKLGYVRFNPQPEPPPHEMKAGF